MDLVQIVNLLQQETNLRANQAARGEDISIKAIHKLCIARKLIEEAYKEFVDPEHIPFDLDHFLGTGEKIPKWE